MLNLTFQSINGQKLNAVEKFTYLGSTLSRSVTIDDEVNIRIAKASSAFGRLRKNVWERRGISIETKLKVYKAVVLTSLMYASETWTVYRRHAKRLNHFHTTSLRKLFGIKWQDKVTDTEVLLRAGFSSIHTMLKQTQLRWAGHVARMPDHRLPKKLLFGELVHGKRSRGGQKKRFKDTLKISLKDFNIDHSSWEEASMERSHWRNVVRDGAKMYEENRIETAEKRRFDRKSRADRSPTAATIPCPHCTRTFRAQIGLVSHLRTHKRMK